MNLLSSHLIENLKVIFISQGDLAGLGWYATLKIIENPEKFFISKKDLSRLVLVGDLPEGSKICSKLVMIKPNQLKSELLNASRKFPLMIVQKKISKVVPGIPNTFLGLRSFQNFQMAMKLWNSIDGAGLVTLPVSKEMITKAGIQFGGHTQFLGTFLNVYPVMCMYHKKLSVISLTEHIPLKEVSDALSGLKVEQIISALNFFYKLFGNKKPIAWLGINPHSGEGGQIGKEEQALKYKLKIFQKKFGLEHFYGFLPADAGFSPHVRKKFSLFLANYHDQALAPFKAIFGLKGLNITLNLPRLRVSPDHGVAYDHALDGDPAGVGEAIRFALKWSEKWNQIYSQLRHPVGC